MSCVAAFLVFNRSMALRGSQAQSNFGMLRPRSAGFDVVPLGFRGCGQAASDFHYHLAADGMSDVLIEMKRVLYAERCQKFMGGLAMRSGKHCVVCAMKQ